MLSQRELGQASLHWLQQIFQGCKNFRSAGGNYVKLINEEQMSTISDNRSGSEISFQYLN